MMHDVCRSPTPITEGQIRATSRKSDVGRQSRKWHRGRYSILIQVMAHLQQSDDHNVKAKEAQARPSVSWGPSEPLTVVGKGRAWTVWLLL